MKKTLHWLDENLEEFLLVVMLAATNCSILIDRHFLLQ